MEVRRPLERMRRPHQQRLVQMPPHQLEADRHAARVEALQKCYETTKALQPAARHAAEEAAFLEILRRRLTEHFNSVAPAAAPPRKA